MIFNKGFGSNHSNFFKTIWNTGKLKYLYGDLLAAIDQSTTGTKFVVFDTKGKQISQNSINHKQISLQNGWLEHDPLEIMVNVSKVIEIGVADLKSRKIDVKQIKSIGITNQRETVVAWNKKTGIPYYNAIVWSDMRTHEIVNRRLTQVQNKINHFKGLNGLPISTYFSAFKIQWLLENIPEISRNISDVLFGTMDTYLTWHLTNNFVTDVTNASRTFLMNLEKLNWDPSLLAEFGLSLSNLAKISSSSNNFGKITHGPLQGLEIGGLIGDQHAACLGHGIADPGELKHTYGTGCFAMMNVGEQAILNKDSALLSTVLYQLKDQKVKYALEGSIEAGGGALNWARDKLGLFTDWDDLTKQSLSVSDNGGVYFIPALQGGLLAPYWQTNMTGSFSGLTLKTKKEHLVRALAESICYRTRDVINRMEFETGLTIKELRVDGGITVNEFLNQFQANVLQKKIIKTKITDSTCLGAALMAGYTAGTWKNFHEVKLMVESEKEYEFDSIKKNTVEDMYKKWSDIISKNISNSI